MWLLKRNCIFTHVRKLSSAASTIFALSSGQGKCGVAVIRISGPNARDAIFKMTKCTELPKPRMAVLHHIKDPVTLEELDKGLVLWFPGPKSFTGEDSCEFQIHGGPAVITSVLSGLSKLPGYCPAEPGDFTKRAFFAGKLDLIEVEGLGDLIHAETELQRKQALFQMEGNLSSKYKNWRSILTKNLAHVEAFIDFSEDENIEDNALELANKNLEKLKNEIENHLADGRKGERLRDGIHTTIIGEPNAGKSSLLNAICQRPAAIVTPVPGTTRDIIETHINVNGYPIILSDTAGLRGSTSDVIEKEGIKRAVASIENSDLILMVIDAFKLKTKSQLLSQQNILNFLTNHLEDLNLSVMSLQHWNKELQNDSFPKFIFVINKIDLLSEDEKKVLYETANNNYQINCISCKNEEGLSTLMKNITKALKLMCPNPNRENPSLTQSRHRHHLNKCLELLNEFHILVDDDVTVAAQKLRLSARHLGKIIGTVTSEEILDIIFKDFCIGK